MCLGSAILNPGGGYLCEILLLLYERRITGGEIDTGSHFYFNFFKFLNKTSVIGFQSKFRVKSCFFFALIRG